MIRRGTSYGPLLPEGVLEDDGADRGPSLTALRWLAELSDRPNEKGVRP